MKTLVGTGKMVGFALGRNG